MVLLATASLAGMGCAPQISHHHAVVATGEHCEEDSGACTAPLLVSNAADLEGALQRWGYEGDAIQWTSGPLLFLGMTDTSDCKVEIAEVNIERSTVEITTQTFLVRRFQDACVTDAIPRSFIIQLDDDASSLLLNGEVVALATS